MTTSRVSVVLICAFAAALSTACGDARSGTSDPPASEVGHAKNTPNTPADDMERLKIEPPVCSPGRPDPEYPDTAPTMDSTATLVDFDAPSATVTPPHLFYEELRPQTVDAEFVYMADAKTSDSCGGGKFAVADGMGKIGNVDDGAPQPDRDECMSISQQDLQGSARIDARPKTLLHERACLVTKKGLVVFVEVDQLEPSANTPHPRLTLKFKTYT